MFSPLVSEQQATVRTSRRRPRPTDSSSVSGEPKSKRQRSALSDDTFLPPEDTQERHETLKKEALKQIASSQIMAVPQREIALRAKKSRLGGDRLSKGDGSVVLVCHSSACSTAC